MLEAALHTAGGKKMDFFLVEDTRLAQPAAQKHFTEAPQAQALGAHDS